MTGPSSMTDKEEEELRLVCKRARFDYERAILEARRERDALMVAAWDGYSATASAAYEAYRKEADKLDSLEEALRK